MRAPHLTLLLALSALFYLGCEAKPAHPSAPVIVASSPIQVAPTVRVSPVPQVYLDLVRHAERAHVQHGGVHVEPDGPGWARVAQLADRGPWAAARVQEGKPMALLESIGATLHLPVGAEGPTLRHLELWLRPIAAGQAVSIFIDEALLTTLHLKQGQHAYRIPLPEGGLSPGEHSLRFWFRFTRWKGKDRVSAALGPVRLLPDGPAPPLPAAWIVPPAEGNVGALLAGPPTGWFYHLVPPAEGRLFARAAVGPGAPVRFIVQVEQDGAARRELHQQVVQGGETAEIDVHLDDFAGRPIRLGLVTEPLPVAAPEGDAGVAPPPAPPTAADFGRVRWIEPQILRPGLPHSQIPPVRNVVVWAVDGLRADRVALGRAGDRAATPNLDLLAAEGVAAVDVWAGGATAIEGHRRLMGPHEPSGSVPGHLVAAGLRTGLFNTNSTLPPELVEAFTTKTDLQQAGEPPETAVMLREVDAWLDVRKRQPFFLYLATRDPLTVMEERARIGRRGPSGTPLPAGLERAVGAETDEAAYDAAVAVSDYWIGQLLALLETHGVLDQTAIIITGTVGAELRPDPHGLSPGLLHVPVVVWHPRLRRAQGMVRTLVTGGDLADLGATIMSFAGVAAPEGWPGIEMATALFNGLPLPPHPSHARQGNQVAARFGTWLLRGVGSRDLRLWDLAEDPFAREEISGDHPIALRTLRDSMLDLP